jgi:hypothetical protein
VGRGNLLFLPNREKVRMRVTGVLRICARVS